MKEGESENIGAGHTEKASKSKSNSPQRHRTDDTTVIFLKVAAFISVCAAGILTLSYLVGFEGIRYIIADTVLLVILSAIVLYLLVVKPVKDVLQRSTRAEVALQESEQKFKSISEYAKDAIIMLGPQGDVSFWNPAAEEMFGYKRSEILGKNLHTLLAPRRYHEAHQKAFVHFQKTGRGGAMGKTLELAALRKDGTEFPIELSVSPLQLKDKWNAVGIVRDISERKRNETKVQRDRDNLNKIFETAPVGFMLVAPDGAVRQVNDVAAALAGRSKAEMLGLQPGDALLCVNACENPLGCGHGPLCSNCPLRGAFEKVLVSGQAIHKAEFQMTLLINGKRIKPWLEVNVGTLEIEGEKNALITITDITRRKQAEREIKLAKERAELIYRVAPNVIFTVDKNRCITSVNDKWTKISGYTAEETLGRKCTEFLLEPCRQKCELFGGDAEKPIIAKECTFRTKGSRRLTVLKSAALLRNGDGSVVGGVESFEDITELKTVQHRQAELMNQLESANSELKDFAYIVSHDLKAPLRGIKALTQWLSADYKDKFDKEGAEQMALLVNRVDRMHNLIEGILQYSRVGRVVEEQEEIDLNKLIPGVIDMVSAPENIEITVDENLPTISCEKTRITQIFENLLSNAVKYMDKSNGRIHIGSSDDGEFWKFIVADNGPGIEQQHFERIFRIFQTLQSRDEFESTGVGLTLVKKIVEQYGGKIWLESEPGKGATFYFTLPKQIVVQSADKAEPAEIASAMN